MLAVANGAYKSGSTWQFTILRELTGFGAPPAEFLTRWKHPSLQARTIGEFLSTGLHRRNDYLVKQHIKRPTLDAFAPYLDDDIRFFDIVRDPRDVVTSAYYHERREGFRGGFRLHYWLRGRRVHKIVRRHHRDMAETIPPQRLCVSSYEGLIADFADELRKMATALGVALAPERIEEIRAKTSMGAMRQSHDDASIIHGKEFFRKGVPGDYANHYGALELRDYREIEGLRKLKLAALIGDPLAAGYHTWRKVRRFLRKPRGASA